MATGRQQTHNRRKLSRMRRKQRRQQIWSLRRYMPAISRQLEAHDNYPEVALNVAFYASEKIALHRVVEQRRQLVEILYAQEQEAPATQA